MLPYNTTNILVKQTDCLPNSKQCLQRRIYFRVLLHIDVTACLASPAYHNIVHLNCQVLSVRVRMADYRLSGDVYMLCV